MPRKKKISQSLYEVLSKEYQTQMLIDPRMKNFVPINLEEIEPPCNLYPEKPAIRQIFWRCDDRPPESLKGTDLTARVDTGLTWRMGGEMDDLDGQTCVCLSKTIEGAIFFPCELKTADATDTYLYAIALNRNYCDSDKMQRIAHRIINPNDHGVGDTYYPYDPLAQEKHGWISPRWLYGEVVTDEVSWQEVVGCWRLERELLIDDGLDTKSGVTVIDKQKVGKKCLESWSEAAELIVNEWFSSIHFNHYYSYGGIIKLNSSTDRPTSAEEAERYYYEYVTTPTDANQKTGKLRPKLELITRAPFSIGFEVSD